jgi:hypothetical protein
MSFGSAPCSFELYEAVDTSSVDEDTLRMTEYLYHLADKAMKEAKEEVRSVLEAQREAEHGCDEAEHGCDEAEHDCDEAEHGCDEAQEGQEGRGPFSVPDDPTVPFEVQFGETSPFDAPDSVATHVTKNKPYSAHSDTSMKVCNHCNRDSRYFDLWMRIFTQCVVANHRTKEEEEQPAVSMKYGIPKIGYYKFLGHFVGDRGGVSDFVPRKGIRRGPAVSMGKLAHAHLQWTGSQGEVQHEIVPVKAMKHLVREVSSSRKFHPFQSSTEMQKQRLRDEGLSTSIEDMIVPRSSHRYRDIIGTLSGTNRFPVVDEDEGEDEGGADPSGSVGPDAGSDGENNAAESSESLAESAGNAADEDVAPGGGRAPPDLSLPSNSFRVGELLDCERIVRDAIIGVPNKYTTSAMVCSGAVAKLLTKAGVTVILTGSNGRAESRVSGAFVRRDRRGRYSLLRPGTSMGAEFNLFAGIATSPQFSSVVNPDRPDVINICRLCKNGASISRNLARALRALRGGSGEVLETMQVRGVGGAATKAGSTPMASDAPGARKDAPTHYIPSFQSLTNRQFQAFLGTVETRACLSVFVRNKYLGPFRMTDARIGCFSKEETKEEKDEMVSALADLRRLGESLDENLSTQYRMSSGVMDIELSSVRETCTTFTLEPIDPNFLQRFQDSANVPWRVAELSEGDFTQRPTVRCRKSDVQQLIGLGEGKEMMNFDDMIDRTQLDWFPRKAGLGNQSRNEEEASDDVVVDDDYDDVVVDDDYDDGGGGGDGGGDGDGGGNGGGNDSGGNGGGNGGGGNGGGNGGGGCP